MKLAIRFSGDLSSCVAILEGIAREGVSASALQIEANELHLECPTTDVVAFQQIQAALLKVPGIETVERVSRFPNQAEADFVAAALDAFTSLVIVANTEGAVRYLNQMARKHIKSEQLRAEDLNVREIFGAASWQQMKTEPHGEILLKDRSFRYFCQKIVDLSKMVEGYSIILNSLASLGAQLSAASVQNSDGFGRLIGRAPPFRQAVDRAKRFASAGAPVLLLGETGTGKELFARGIHLASPRRDQPFLALNCAALPEHLVESELFGHAAGSFTGASKDGKPGLFELADGGTLFLDEIGEMTPMTQAKILRVLQDGTFRRVGDAARERRAKVVVISATHRNLEELCRQRQFREDLFWRLSTLSLRLPALRERRSDIPILIDHFLSRSEQHLGRCIPRPSERQIVALMERKWPGNIRELESAIFRAAVLAVDALEFDERHPVSEQEEIQLNGEQASNPRTWDEEKSIFERTLLKKLAPQYPSTRALAERLGISHTMVADKLRAYGIRCGRPVLEPANERL